MYVVIILTIDIYLSIIIIIIIVFIFITYQQNPRSRLCCKNGIEELKLLPYFTVIDWEQLYDRKILMPYAPKLASDMDVSSFETTFTKGTRS